MFQELTKKIRKIPEELKILLQPGSLFEYLEKYQLLLNHYQENINDEINLILHQDNLSANLNNIKYLIKLQEQMNHEYIEQIESLTFMILKENIPFHPQLIKKILDNNKLTLFTQKNIALICMKDASNGGVELLNILLKHADLNKGALYGMACSKNLTIELLNTILDLKFFDDYVMFDLIDCQLDNEQIRERLFNHPVMNVNMLNLTIKAAYKYSSPLAILYNVLQSTEVDSRILLDLAKSTQADHNLLNDVLNHPKITGDVITQIIKNPCFNQNLFKNVLIHPKLHEIHLLLLVMFNLNNLDLLKELINHPKVGDLTLIQMIRSPRADLTLLNLIT